MVLNESSGQLGFQIQNMGFVAVERAIGLAHKHRHPDSHNRVTCTGDVLSRNVHWHTEESNNEELNILGETWKALKCSVGIVQVDPRYQISNLCRLMCPKGRITRGYHFRDTRLAATNAGLLDLFIAGKKKSPQVFMPKHVIDVAFGVIEQQLSITCYARQKELLVSSAYNYLYKALVHAPVRKLRRTAQNVVSADCWAFMQELSNEEHPIFSGKLTDLLDFVLKALSKKRRLKGDFFHSKYQYDELRIARIAIQKNG